MAAGDAVMVATDLSARSDRPFERGFLLSEQLGTSLLVLHVLERDDIATQDKERLLELIEQEFAVNEANSEILLVEGGVTDTIVRVAAERNCSVIITGVARFNSPGDYVLGTAVDHIVRRSEVPVLVVKRRPRKPYVRLLVGTDFSSCSRNALLTAARLFAQAKLCLLHVYHSSYDAFLAHETTAEHIRQRAAEEMEGFTSSLPGEVSERLETRLAEGHIAAVFEEQIRDWKADLLVLGAHGRGGFAQATIGSQTADLLKYEPCDVLTVRRERG